MDLPGPEPEGGAPAVATSEEVAPAAAVAKAPGPESASEEAAPAGVAPATEEPVPEPPSRQGELTRRAEPPADLPPAHADTEKDAELRFSTGDSLDVTLRDAPGRST